MAGSAASPCLPRAISVHTWPERGYAAFDVFMCGSAEPRKALAVLEKAFAPERVVVGIHKRGVL
jgi:S-adenosylmethionine decarboxylase